VTFETAVRLQFDRFRGFVEEFSANLSLGGMFIRTDEPGEIGDEMPIEFRLGEDYELIRGKGRVVWARQEALDDEHPAGMGIRFLELTPGSRELIFKLVERRVREGGEPFDLEAEAEILDDLPQRPPDPGPAPERVLSETAPGAPVLEAVAEETAMSAETPLPEPPPDEADGVDEEFDPWAEPLPDLVPELETATAPEATAPETTAPESTAPETTVPETTAPEASTPEIPLPEFTSPESTAPGSTAPDAIERKSTASHDDREPFYLGDGPGAGPGDPDEPGFSDETFTSRTSRAVSPFGTASAGVAATREAASNDEPDEPYEPALPEAPAATPSMGYTPEGRGAAYDNEEERSFVRRRGMVLGLILVLVFGGLALGWWLLGQPPELRSAAQPQGGVAPVAEEPPQEGSGAPVSSVDASDVEGGFEGVRATPPDLEPDRERERQPDPGEGNADEGLRGTAAGDVGTRTAEPSPATAADGALDAQASPRAGEPPGAAASGPLAIQRVSHQAAGSRTVVIIQANRPLGQGDYADFRIGGLSPRHVVRLLGVEQPLPAGQVTVGTNQVARVRSGLHLDRDPSELHLVLDFNSDSARVTEITPAGDTLRVVVEEGAG